ncbi:VOC family protein [Sphingorhabdus sp. Alg239-R122]|uniref:VOC family protein n=1 Tax=Sphingorhabdus sp. Alg239-R122 TaxID=2305989 RepID=UPI0013D999B1|nr:VOC family protein [Sphingorhabdus sp. Alg239-R122]
MQNKDDIASSGITLSGLALHVHSPDALARFYTEYLGMQAQQAGDELRVGYGPQSAYMALRPASDKKPYRHAPNDRYWKIGITLPDLDMAYRQLKEKGAQITTPQQFGDIGYLCHVTDPEGFQVELLQHSFAGQPKTVGGDSTLPLGGGAMIAHITLRTSNIDAELAHYRDQLGMRLLSVQPVPDYNFTLYFLAFTGDTPPHEDLTAVENRPWLWQRPYGVLEIQHRQADDTKIRQTPDNQCGFAELVIG